MTSSVSGLLPWSTRYAVQLGGEMRLESPIATQSNEREWDNTLSINVTQPLLQGFGGAAGADQRRAADLSAQAARARHARQVETLLADVETAYLQLAQRDAEEAAARASLDRAVALLERNEELHALERISELDLISSRSGVAQRRRAVIEARQLRRDAADRLVSLVYGEQAPHYLESLAPRLATAEVAIPVPTLPAPAESADRAARSRRDVAASRLDRARQETQLGTARNLMLPDLSVGATYTTTGNNTARAFQFDPDRDGDFAGDGWSASLSFSLPVLNRERRGAYEQSRALVRQADFLVSAAENLARVDARIAHRAVRVGQEVLDEAAEALDLARAHYDGERERQNLGLSDSFRLLQVEDEMAAAALAEIEARFNVFLAVTQYELAVGGILLEKYDVPEYFISY
ncbi:MAG TPA: TolC family protein [Longimicrobiales bacterium]|nr:TolC family protein [Longimicrobiales bacterium]